MGQNGTLETGKGTGAAEPRLAASVPILASLDFDETQAFYAGLGFSTVFRDVGLLGLVRDEVRLHFWLTGNRRVPRSASCRIDVCGIEALFEQFRTRGVIHRRGRLETKPWGLREFDVADCHGNLLRFCEPAN